MDTLIIGALTLIATVIIGILSLRYMRKQINSKETKKTIQSIDRKSEPREEHDIEKPIPLLINSYDLTDKQIKNLSVLIRGSYHLLQADRLNGSWGKTIGKYLELTQDEGKWSEENVFKYILTGSLTNTYHALNGLCEYHRLIPIFFDPDIVFNIIYYLKTWRLDFGAFATPVTNFDGSWGNPNVMDGHEADLFRKQIPQLIRHTSCGILTINRLLELRTISRKSLNSTTKDLHKWEEMVETLNNFNLCALKVLSTYSRRIEIDDPSIWGKVRYTPAYVILAIDEGLKKYSKELSKDDEENLKRIKSQLIEFAYNNALETGERYFCQNSNKKAYYYYTLLFLENYLNIAQFTDHEHADSFCRKLLQSLSDIVTSTNGLSFGNADIPNKPWLNFADIGITARYIFVLSKYSNIFNVNSEFNEAFRKSLNFVLDNVYDFESSTKNFTTQGWEAILKLISLLDDSLKMKLKENISDKKTAQGKELNKFISTIAYRDFHGRAPSDQQYKLIEFLSNDQNFSKITKNLKGKNEFNLLNNYKFLKEQIEINFNKNSFVELLNRNKIPFREDANFENMVDLILFQFQFKKDI